MSLQDTPRIPAVTHSQTSRGFTLIEVLVASVILFAGLGAVLKSYSLAVVAMESAADKLAVCQVIEEKAEELDVQVSSGDALPAGGGRQMVGGFEYQWRVDATRQVLTPQVSVVRAEIEVVRANRSQIDSCFCEWTQFRGKESPR